MKRSIFLLLLLTLAIAFLSLLLVLFRMSPLEDTAWLAYTLFFISLSVTASSVLALVGALVRLWMFRESMYMMHFLIALRQGVLLALCVTGYVALSALMVDTWWNVLLLCFTFGFVELYFLGRDSVV